MKKILFLLVLLANGVFAQDFNNYDFNTQYSSQLNDVIEYETGYLLTGYITDSSFTVTRDLYGNPVLIKLSKSGVPIDTFYTDSFGYSELAQVSVYKNGYFYMFGTTNPYNDSIQLVVNKYDTLFNFIEKKQYPQISDDYYITIQKTNNTTDSTMYLIGAQFNDIEYHYNSVIFKYNFSTMQLSKFGYVPENFLAYNLIVNEQEDKYILSGNSSSFKARVLTYDSSFTLLSSDTLFDPWTTNATLQSTINIKKYNDSSYLCLGVGELNVPIANPTHFIRALELQILDSNFKYQDYKYWYYDSISYFDLSSSNALTINTNNEYFIGSTIHINFYYPDSGLLIVKIDSNLNTLWQKHLNCEAMSMHLNNMLPTSDGGVLVLYTEQASLYGAELQNSKLVKIGPNGEVTNITELNLHNRKALVNIYPNPTSQNLSISLLAKNQYIKEIRIYNLQFKEILNRQINAKQSTIDVSKFAKGVYILEGKTNTAEPFMEKFVVE